MPLCIVRVTKMVLTTFLQPYPYGPKLTYHSLNILLKWEQFTLTVLKTKVYKSPLIIK